MYGGSGVVSICRLLRVLGAYQPQCHVQTVSASLNINTRAKLSMEKTQSHHPAHEESRESEVDDVEFTQSPESACSSSDARVIINSDSMDNSNEAKDLRVLKDTPAHPEDLSVVKGEPSSSSQSRPMPPVPRLKEGQLMDDVCRPRVTAFSVSDILDPGKFTKPKEKDYNPDVWHPWKERRLRDEG